MCFKKIAMGQTKTDTIPYFKSQLAKHDIITYILKCFRYMRQRCNLRN